VAQTSGLDRLSPQMKSALRGYVQQRMEILRSYRVTWWSHWSLLAEMFLPRRYRYFVTANQWARGSPINQAIVDETGLLAARTLATGLLSGLTSPTKPWFRLGLQGIDDIPEGPIAVWLADCTKRMLAVYAGSNFYQALGQAYHDLVVFGTAVLIQYADENDVVHFSYPPLGTYMLGLNAKNEVDTFYEEYTYTAKQAVDEFGLENVSISTRELYKQPSGKDTEVIIGHSIEPNADVYEAGAKNLGLVCPAKFPYREVYWERGSATGIIGDGQLLRVRPFSEIPFMALRWDVTANDAYGRSPGMDALPAVRQLQIQQRRLAEAIDKQVRPPMVASVNMKNEPMDILPGGVSFVADPAASGFKPAFTVTPQVNELNQNISLTQTRVKETMFNNLFTTITDLDTVRTATDIDARRAEATVLIGPVIERTQSEGLDDGVGRTFAEMSRRSLFLPPPPEIQGAEIEVRYISMLAEVQRAAGTASIERFFGFVGSLSALKPDTVDMADFDKGVEEYGELLTVSPELIRATQQVLAIREARAKQEQAAAALQVGAEAANAGKTLSETQVGGGINALQLALGQAA